MTGAIDLGGLAALGNDPHRVASLRSSLDLGPAWRWDIDVRRVGARPNPVVPAYTAVDTRLAWRVTSGADSCSACQNLFDRAMPSGARRRTGSRSSAATSCSCACGHEACARARTVRTGRLIVDRRGAGRRPGGDRRCSPWRSPPAAGEALEASVKAAYLYKFLSYVDWPAAAFAAADAPQVIGVVGADEVHGRAAAARRRAPRQRPSRSSRASRRRRLARRRCTCCFVGRGARAAGGVPRSRASRS